MKNLFKIKKNKQKINNYKEIIILIIDILLIIEIKMDIIIIIIIMDNNLLNGNNHINISPHNKLEQTILINNNHIAPIA